MQPGRMLRFKKAIAFFTICFLLSAGFFLYASRAVTETPQSTRPTRESYISDKPVSSPTSVASEKFTKQDYKKHIDELKKRLPHNGFHIVIQKPFVVIGDESLETVKRRADKTVRWSAEKLKQLYFTEEPNDILEIWLFKDKESYRKYTKEIFNDRPTTPFGYYSYTHKALIMNIATGGGTLVHEIVHPYIASNFENCPSWFNEGLASLYEQCGEENGRIHGYTNWRLRGLQQAIKNGKVPSFKTLCSTTTHRFYNTDPGTNYSQARYLCYYLQQKGLLVKFYRAFRNNVKTDPTGYDTLRKVLDVEDMNRFQKSWEKFVSDLR